MDIFPLSGFWWRCMEWMCSRRQRYTKLNFIFILFTLSLTSRVVRSTNTPLENEHTPVDIVFILVTLMLKKGKLHRLQ